MNKNSFYSMLTDVGKKSPVVSFDLKFNSTTYYNFSIRKIVVKF